MNRIRREAMQMEQHTVEVDPTTIYYQVAGEGPPVVLLHGLSGSTRWWSRNVPALAAHFRVYVIDLIGFGRSRSKHRFVLADAAHVLRRWMDSLGITRASVVGHSMGGVIAVDLAAAYPARVDCLVLVDAAVMGLQRTYLQSAVGLARAVHRLPLNFWPILVTDAWKAGPRTLYKAGRELLTTDVAPRLERIVAPTLVVWGAHDDAVPLEIGRRLADGVARANLIVLDGAGHNPMWDRPDAFNQAVVDFLTAAPS